VQDRQLSASELKHDLHTGSHAIGIKIYKIRTQVPKAFLK